MSLEETIDRVVGFVDAACRRNGWPIRELEDFPTAHLLNPEPLLDGGFDTNMDLAIRRAELLQTVSAGIEDPLPWIHRVARRYVPQRAGHYDDKITREQRKLYEQLTQPHVLLHVASRFDLRSILRPSTGMVRDRVKGKPTRVAVGSLTDEQLSERYQANEATDLSKSSMESDAASLDSPSIKRETKEAGSTYRFDKDAVPGSGIYWSSKGALSDYALVCDEIFRRMILSNLDLLTGGPQSKAYCTALGGWGYSPCTKPEGLDSELTDVFDEIMNCVCADLMVGRNMLNLRNQLRVMLKIARIGAPLQRAVVVRLSELPAHLVPATASADVIKKANIVEVSLDAAQLMRTVHTALVKGLGLTTESAILVMAPFMVPTSSSGVLPRRRKICSSPLMFGDSYEHDSCPIAMEVDHPAIVSEQLTEGTHWLHSNFLKLARSARHAQVRVLRLSERAQRAS